MYNYLALLNIHQGSTYGKSLLLILSTKNAYAVHVYPLTIKPPYFFELKTSYYIYVFSHGYCMKSNVCVIIDYSRSDRWSKFIVNNFVLYSTRRKHRKRCSPMSSYPFGIPDEPGVGFSTTISFFAIYYMGVSKPATHLCPRSDIN